MSYFMYLFIYIIIFFLISSLFKKKEEICQIESGFENLDKTSLKNFSINFFFILIIFIIFDLELVILLPFVYKSHFNYCFFILLFIVITFFMEILMNKVIWKN